MQKKAVSGFILFLFGGICYSFLEIMWRGFTHWTMFLLGGICYLIIGKLADRCCGKLPLWFCCFVGTLAITALEFATGCVVNLTLKWNVWNYQDQPLNLMGQVCLGFTSLWFLLSIPVTEIAFRMQQKLEEKMSCERR